MKLVLLALALFSFHFTASAAGCNGSTTSCYSNCDHGYVPVVGNKCESFYDMQRHCYNVRGACGGSPGNPGNTSCRGSTTCYSNCDHKYVTFQNANSCTTAYSNVRHCYEALGFCKQ